MPKGVRQTLSIAPSSESTEEAPKFKLTPLTQVLRELIHSCTVREFNEAGGIVTHSEHGVPLIGVFGIECEEEEEAKENGEQANPLVLFLDGREIGPLDTAFSDYLPALGCHMERRAVRKTRELPFTEPPSASQPSAQQPSASQPSASQPSAQRRLTRLHGPPPETYEVSVPNNRTHAQLVVDKILPAEPFIAVTHYDRPVIMGDPDTKIRVRGFNISCEDDGYTYWMYN